MHLLVAQTKKDLLLRAKPPHAKAAQTAVYRLVLCYINYSYPVSGRLGVEAG